MQEFGVHVLRIVKTREILVGIKNEHNGLGVRNMSDPMLKEIYGRYRTKDLQMNKKKKKKTKWLKKIFLKSILI